MKALLFASLAAISLTSGVAYADTSCAQVTRMMETKDWTNLKFETRLGLLEIYSNPQVKLILKKEPEAKRDRNIAATAIRYCALMPKVTFAKSMDVAFSLQVADEME